MFNWFKRKPKDLGGQGNIVRRFSKGGVEFSALNIGDIAAYQWIHDPGLFSCWEKVALLGQLESEGLAIASEDAVLIGWTELFSALCHPEYSSCAPLLDLPNWASVGIELNTRGSLSDEDFELSANWIDAHGRPLSEQIERIGAVISRHNKQELLSEPSWKLIEAVTEFSQRGSEDRKQLEQERFWGRLRQLARAAGVKLDRYLERTVIVSAEKLDMTMRVGQVSDTQVVEVAPLIASVPDELWLDAFDGFQHVQDHYDLNPPKGGRIRVILEPNAKAVLREIKKMPRRRISGARAETFLRNPFSLLGETMGEVVSPEAFESARESAGVHLYDFKASVLREKDGHIQSLRVDLEGRDEKAPRLPSIEIETREFAEQFSKTLRTALESEAICFQWHRHTLEIRGDAEDQLSQIRAWLCESWSGEPLISFDEVFDLSGYAPRVSGIGIHQPQYVPYLARKDASGGWLPENLESLVEFRSKGGDTTLIPVTSEAKTAIETWLNSEPSPDSRFFPPGWPSPVTPPEAQQLVETLVTGGTKLPQKMIDHGHEKGSLDENESIARGLRKTLSIRQNVDELEYSEERHSDLAFDPETIPEITGWLKPEVVLKPHQKVGIAWLQHLCRKQNLGVRGALLADDMGLGKTLQLLCLIAWYLEQSTISDPALVVAPVSLLENWQAEIDKFFDHRLGVLVLPLYGKALRERKVKRSSVDEQLQDEKIKGFLKPEWLTSAKLILTTYETLRDLEFSLARVRWSIIVCDEAQKIKTPGSLVTHAAKAQNASFKIACTGTPVENSLADLWCLFDFIQPGLLKSLSEFCRTYRRPIESKSDAEARKLEELRHLIDPQVLRRLKSDVADLPEKRTNDECRRLDLSNFQLRLYKQATEQFKGQYEKNGSAILGFLHTLRSICADPRENEGDSVQQVSIQQHFERSPKLLWLIQKLEDIKRTGDKAIIFTEFRDLQRTIQYRIRERFGFSPVIINGGTRVGADGGSNSRQALIDAFQAKMGFGVLILSTTAVGFGVNIQAANHVIHFTRAWNPAKEDQATDRAYRIGQTKSVHVYYPTVVSPSFETFEARLDGLLEIKRQLASDMLNGTGEIDITEWGSIAGA